MRTVRQWRVTGLLLVLLGASLWVAPPPVAAGADDVTTCANGGPGSLPAVVAGAAANDTIVFAAVFRSAGTVTVTATDTQVSTLTGQASAAIAPEVTAVGPAAGGTAGGNHITLTGLGFGTTPSNVSVTIDNNPAPVASVANMQIVVTAPAHAAGTVNVVVTVNGQATTMTGG